MSGRLMLLPAHDYDHMRLLRIPDDMGERDALRHVTALIASAQEDCPTCGWEEIRPILEDHGFSAVEFQLGPELG